MKTTDTNPGSIPTGLQLWEYRRIFKTLPPLEREQFEGRFEGLLLGPKPLQRAFQQALKAGGLAGWAGKEFHDGVGYNLCLREGQEQQVQRMKIQGTVKSVIDGQDTLALTYFKAPLSVLTDELRAYDAQTILGMTYVNAGPLKHLTFPFALRRAAAGGG